MKNDNDGLLELQKTFQKLYGDELPEFISTLKSTDNLPSDILNTLATVERNIKKNEELLSPILDKKGIGDILGGVGAATEAGVALGSIAAGGGIVSGVFAKLSKKKEIQQLSGKKLIAVKDSASLFEETIQRMEQLLVKTKSGESETANYEKLTPVEKEELKLLAQQMQDLSTELTNQLAA
jgi:hypothetical protein